MAWNWKKNTKDINFDREILFCRFLSNETAEFLQPAESSDKRASKFGFFLYINSKQFF